MKHWMILLTAKKNTLHRKKFPSISHSVRMINQTSSDFLIKKLEIFSAKQKLLMNFWRTIINLGGSSKLPGKITATDHSSSGLFQGRFSWGITWNTNFHVVILETYESWYNDISSVLLIIKLVNKMKIILFKNKNLEYLPLKKKLR